MNLTLTPAYGRDYKNGKEVRADWAAGKDFIVSNLFSSSDGKYINIEDAKNDSNINSVNIRYKELRNVVVINCTR